MLTERCKSCLHLKTEHKFAKKGESYTSAKGYSWNPQAFQITIENLAGFCNNPLCTCIAFVAGGTEDDYQDRQRRSTAYSGSFRVGSEHPKPAVVEIEPERERSADSPKPRKKQSGKRADKTSTAQKGFGF